MQGEPYVSNVAAAGAGVGVRVRAAGVGQVTAGPPVSAGLVLVTALPCTITPYTGTFSPAFLRHINARFKGFIQPVS